MATKTLLSLATVSLLAFAAKADDPARYTVETTNSWFSVTAASVPLNATNWGEVKPTRPASVLNVDTTAAAPVTYDPTESIPATSTRYRVKGNMTVTLNAGVPANDVFGVTSPKAALVAASVNEGNKWYGWDGTQWVVLSNITTPPADGTAYPVAIEFFVVSEQLNIKYIVGNESQTVTTIEDELPELTKVGLAGYGSFGDFGALGFESFEVTTTKTKAELEAAGLDVADGQTVEEALNSEGGNGLPQWQSLALGIDPSTEKPYTAPVQTSNGNLGFAIGNYGTPSVNGTVTFDVYECNAQGVISGGRVGYANAGSTAEVTAPTANDGVKYYKIKIKFQ